MDVMIDLETLGTSHNALILSAGFLRFDPQNCQQTFEDLLRETSHIVVNLAASYEDVCAPGIREYGNGGQINMQTLTWHLSQLPAFSSDQLTKIADLRTMLQYIGCLFPSGNDFPERVWANAPSFDLAILKNAYSRDAVPWKFFQERDVRTLLDAANIDKRQKEWLPNGLIKHRADHDAAWQAWLVQQAWARLWPL